jgi:hypothetical protein
MHHGVPLLTTASQARRAPRATPPADAQQLPGDAWLVCRLDFSSVSCGNSREITQKLESPEFSPSGNLRMSRYGVYGLGIGDVSIDGVRNG